MGIDCARTCPKEAHTQRAQLAGGQQLASTKAWAGLTSGCFGGTHFLWWCSAYHVFTCAAAAAAISLRCIGLLVADGVENDVKVAIFCYFFYASLAVWRLHSVQPALMSCLVMYDAAQRDLVCVHIWNCV